MGEVLGPVAFSSLTATRTWLQTPEATRFMRAYSRAREWVRTAPAAEIAQAEQAMFPTIALPALTQTIAYYQQLGCWDPPVTISRETYEVALDVFQLAKLITQRHPYEQVVVPPEGVKRSWSQAGSLCVPHRPMTTGWRPHGMECRPFGTTDFPLGDNT